MDIKKQNLLLKRLLIPVFLLLLGFSSIGQASVAFVFSSKTHQKLISSIESQLPSAESEQYRLDEVTSNELSNHELIVSFGTKSAKWILEQGIQNTPVIFTLVSHHFAKSSLSDSKNHYSIVLDQPISRQIELVKKLLPETRSIGVLLGPQSKWQLNEIATAINQYKIELITKQISDKDQVQSAISNLTKDIDVLLAIPDKTVFNRYSIQNILLSTYRHHIPIIGYSAAYVKAGALASAYSDLKQISKHITELIRNIHQGGKPDQQIMNPTYFSVKTNSTVAKSLNLVIEE